MLDFESVEAGAVSMSDDYLGTQDLRNGILTMSWNDVVPTQVKHGEVLFTLEFTARSAGILSEMVEFNSTVTQAEAYDAAGQASTLELIFNDKLTPEVEFELFQNNPNPFSDETLITYHLPQQANAALTIYDVTGKVIMVIEEQARAGKNTMRIDADQLSANGVLYYRLETEKYSATRKMIRL